MKYILIGKDTTTNGECKEKACADPEFFLEGGGPRNTYVCQAVQGMRHMFCNFTM